MIVASRHNMGLHGDRFAPLSHVVAWMEVFKNIALVYLCFSFMKVQIVSNLQFALNCSILVLRGWGF
jgi:UDP-2,3-diacylglucosamine pyrophosphatase LpxH